MSNSTPNVLDLFASAQNDGVIGKAASAALNLVDLGQNIQAAMGVSVDDVQSSSVVLISVLVDDSGSIAILRGGKSNVQSVIDGVNLIKKSLSKTKQVDGILMSIRFLNGTILCPFVSLDKVPELNGQNYNPNGGTPLYDQTLAVLGTMLAKSQEFSDKGVPCRTITVIVTDGADMHSHRADAGDCRSVVEDMRNAENHIVAAMGIEDGHTDFRAVFGSMGLEDKWVLTPGNDEHSIRTAFDTVSQSAVRASQGMQPFSQTQLGGFGN